MVTTTNLTTSIPLKVSSLTVCNLIILSKLQVLQIRVLKYSILQLPGLVVAAGSGGCSRGGPIGGIVRVLS